MLLAGVLMLTNVSLSYTQTPNVTTLSYQAFDQLATVYRSGGSAPSLLSGFNSALALIEAARVERTRGNTANALALEDQARSIIQRISSQIPAAQQQAAQQSYLKLQIFVVSGAMVVALLTLVFYGSIRVWRWYEKEKLFEMRIIADETKD
jgi:hypothetical protein